MKHAYTKSTMALASLLCAGGLLASMTGCERGESARQPKPVAAEPEQAPAPETSPTQTQPQPEDGEIAAEALVDGMNADAGDDAVAPGTMIGEGMQFTPAAEWVSSKPSSSMRFAQFTLPANGDDTSDAAELVVYYFGNTGAGSIDSNITRWIGQIAQPDGSDSRDAATIETRDLNGLKTTMVDLTGTYVAETSPGSGEFLNEADQRLVAAIVETDAGPYYFKLTGSDATVSQVLGSWEAMLETIKPASVMGSSDAASHPG